VVLLAARKSGVGDRQGSGRAEVGYGRGASVVGWMMMVSRRGSGLDEILVMMMMASRPAGVCGKDGRGVDV